MGAWHARFDGEVALVTGGAAGIGLAIARALFDAGARVHVFDCAPSSASDSIRRHAVDLRRTDEVDAAVSALAAEEGRIDLLVNNAGITRDAVLWKLDDEAWNDVIDVNLTGAFRVLRSVANLTRRDGEDFMAVAARIPVRTEVENHRLEAANEALGRLRRGDVQGAAVLVP